MRPNPSYIQNLLHNNGWSHTEFAEKLCMSRALVNRFFNGKRKGGATFAGRIIKLFPNEPLDKLFFLD